MRTVRFPTAVMDQVRRYAALGGRPVNTELIYLLQEALTMRQEYGEAQERYYVAGANRRTVLR
jgi:hypothetical protein